MTVNTGRENTFFQALSEPNGVTPALMGLLVMSDEAASAGTTDSGKRTRGRAFRSVAALAPNPNNLTPTAEIPVDFEE